MRLIFEMLKIKELSKGDIYCIEAEDTDKIHCKTGLTKIEKEKENELVFRVVVKGKNNKRLK